MKELNFATLEDGAKYYSLIKGQAAPKPIRKILIGGLSQSTDEYFIPSPRGQKNNFAIQALDKLAAKLVDLNDGFDSDDVLNSSLADFLANFNGNSDANPIKKVLKRDHTGIIIPVTNRLKTFTLSPTIQMILSYEPIYQYLLYRVIEGLKITKTDGIISGIRDTVLIIQQYINGEMVKSVLDSRNLKYNDKDLKSIKAKALDSNLDYTSSNMETRLLDLYHQQSSSSEILSQIENFLDSGAVKIPTGVSRESLINSMLEYLKKVGYEPSTVPILSPTLVAPDSASKIETQPVSFLWSEVKTASHYEWQLSSADDLEVDKGFGRDNIIDEKVTFGPSLKYNENLADGFYYWSARAVLDGIEKTNFSTAVLFKVEAKAGSNSGSSSGTTIPSSPASAQVDSPILIEPDDGQIKKDEPIRFNWEPIDNVFYYMIQVADKDDWHPSVGFDPDCVLEERRVKNPAFNLTEGIIQNGTYYWTVQVVLNDGTRSNFSDIRELIYEAPSGHTNVVKDNLTIIQGITPKIQTILNDNGITSFNDIARMKSNEINDLLSKEGINMSSKVISKWPDQAEGLDNRIL